MSIEIYDATIPVFVNMMRNLTALLDKAESWSSESGLSPESLADTRLATDMFPLTRQIYIVSDTAKGAAARLAGMEVPSFPDTEVTFPELKQRLAKTIAFVNSVTPEQVNGNEGRIIELRFARRPMTFTATDYVFQFALPNFMFHVVTAYGLMRSRGVPLGKMDYLAGSNALYPQVAPGSSPAASGAD
ncbi:DUF1993 domain-containing protein [Roseixanthobacter glucoisosaccharinicivorans]|uniref:DUF1993 domain-containing protein n=1 Tax=Roseixanthobacter glucoisosaccharinicivorans TaxID=3119923 RepID=UPI00372C9912